MPVTSDLDGQLFGLGQERGSGRLARRRNQPVRPHLLRGARPHRGGARPRRGRPSRGYHPRYGSEPARRRVQRRDARDDRARGRTRDRRGSPRSRDAHSVDLPIWNATPVAAAARPARVCIYAHSASVAAQSWREALHWDCTFCAGTTVRWKGSPTDRGRRSRTWRHR